MHYKTVDNRVAIQTTGNMEYMESDIQVKQEKDATDSKMYVFSLSSFVNFHFSIISFYFDCDFRLCCECGILIEPNPANMCVHCLRNHVDITEGKASNFSAINLPNTSN